MYCLVEFGEGYLSDREQWNVIERLVRVKVAAGLRKGIRVREARFQSVDGIIPHWVLARYSAAVFAWASRRSGRPS